MRSSVGQATLERVVTGETCDEKGCYELAAWVVSWGDEAHHWCPMHTRVEMRKPSRWRSLASEELSV